MLPRCLRADAAKAGPAVQGNGLFQIPAGSTLKNQSSHPSMARSEEYVTPFLSCEPLQAKNSFEGSKMAPHFSSHSSSEAGTRMNLLFTEKETEAQRAKKLAQERALLSSLC